MPMEKFEKHYRLIQPTVHRWTRLSLFGKRLEVKGEENFPRRGPAIIVGNHCGSYKDIATLLEIMPQLVYFTANKLIFTKEDFNHMITVHLKRHMKEFGFIFDFAVKPIKAPFVNFVSSNIKKIGCIPVDLDGGGRLAIDNCKEYLQKGRVIVLLQGMGRVMPAHPHPYVSPFRNGPSLLANILYRKSGIVVPIVPVAFFGTQLPWIIPGKIKVNIGLPMKITDILNQSEDNRILRFRDAMEKRVRKLFLELLRE